MSIGHTMVMSLCSTLSSYNLFDIIIGNKWDIHGDKLIIWW